MLDYTSIKQLAKQIGRSTKDLVWLTARLEDRLTFFSLADQHVVDSPEVHAVGKSEPVPNSCEPLRFSLPTWNTGVEGVILYRQGYEVLGRSTDLFGELLDRGVNAKRLVDSAFLA